MNDTPTRGPVRTSITQNARAESNSRHSFSNSQRAGVLREGKEDLLEGVSGAALRETGGRGQFRERAFSPDTTAAQQDESITQTRGVRDLVDGEKEGASAREIGR